MMSSLAAIGALSVISCCAGSMLAEAMPVILDTDIGDDIDDTWALVMLLRSPQLDVKLITTTFGKSEYRTKLIARLLTVAGRSDIPVGMGAGGSGGAGGQEPWVKDFDPEKYRGKVHKDGVQALIDAVKASPEPIRIISIGPSSTVAAALERQPDMARKAIFIGMQGSVRKGYNGADKPCPEYNVKENIPAAQRVFSAPWREAVITPLDTCGLVKIDGPRFQQLADSNDPLLKALMENCRIWAKKEDVRASSVLFDTVAVYLAYPGPKPLLEMEELRVRVTEGGMTAIDPAGAKMQVAAKWKDMEGYEDLLVKTLLSRKETDLVRKKIVATEILTSTLCGGGAAAADTPAKMPATRTRFLLLDSRIIESTENAELTVGVVRKDKNNPLFKEDKPWEPRFDNPYCSVIYDEEEKVYKCWYSIFIRSGPSGDFPGEGLPPDKRAWVNWREGARGFGVCYATSIDGIHWEKPELGLIDFNGDKKNNIVIVYNHGVAVIKDLHETDPRKRYKAIHPEEKDSFVWFSPDGIRWGNKQSVGPIARGDTNQAVWWDEDLGKYVLITRQWGGETTGDRYGSHGHRHKVRSESADFLTWSKPEHVIKGLDLRLQIHDMPVVKHAGVYLGMVGLFDIEANRQWCELAWSPDSIDWHRIQPGKPLIPNGPVMGDCDWGCIFTSVPLIRKDEILMYYGANDGRFMGWRSGYICLARLRPDGFAGYEQQFPGGHNKTATITTRPVAVAAGSLRISADVAPSGYVKVTALDKDNNKLAEGELIAKTVTDAAVQWKNGFSLKALEGKEIKLSFELRDSKLYSFSFAK